MVYLCFGNRLNYSLHLKQMATIKIILYKQKVYSSGESPVMLQIVENSKASRISLSMTSSVQQWDAGRCRFKRSAPDYTIKNQILLGVEQRAESILQELRANDLSYSKHAFLSRLMGQSQSISIENMFKRRIDELKSRSQVGNLRVYKDTRRALKSYCAIERLNLQDIDYQFLKGFETRLIAQGATGGGISVYMRTLRALINEAIHQGFLSRESYPFARSRREPGKYSFSHLKSRKNPRPLSISDMDAFKSYDNPRRPDLIIAKNVFLLSYYGQGINFSDLADLQWTDIQGGRIRYIRNKNHKEISIPITSQMASVLDFCKTISTSTYMLPILDDSKYQSALQKQDRKLNTLKKFNRQLKEIAIELGIETPITSYTARHTYANTIHQQGGGTEALSRSMGHADAKTTQHYLKTLDNSTTDDLHKYL